MLFEQSVSKEMPQLRTVPHSSALAFGRYLWSCYHN